MKRIFFWSFASLGLFILVYFGLNLFDSKTAPDSMAAEPLAANLEPGNGFFLIWGFAEPPAIDLLAPAFRDQMLELIESQSRSYLFRSLYGQWLARLNTGFRLQWQGASLYFPLLPDEDICAYFSSRRAQVAERLERFAVPLQRYRQVMRAGKLADFTPMNWELPSRSLLLATFTARLFAASRALAALDGQWLAAGDDLLDAMDAGFKLVGTARTIAVNSLGKTMVELSLRTLASLFNRRDCPPCFVRLVLEKLPDRPIGRFGTGPVRAFNGMSFTAAVGLVKERQIVDPFLLKDFFRDPAAFYTLERFVAISGLRLFRTVHALASFFVKANETASMLKTFWNDVGALEEVPPWKWGSPPLRDRRSSAAASGPFWWLRNPLGKMMVHSAVPYNWPVLQHYVYRSHELKARYELTRLLARARLAAGLEMKMNAAALQRLLDAAAERDPFSGSSYRFSREWETLFSIGPDRRDDRGRERLESWRNSDITVPIRFVNRDE